MIAALALALGALAGVADEPRVDGRWEIEPRSPQLGLPVRWTLVLGHPRGLDVQAKAKDLRLDDTWVVFASAGPVALPDPADPGRVIVRRTWDVASLEPGPRAVPSLEFEYEAGGALRTVRVRGPELDVRGVLAEGEDAPRPLLGFRDVGALPEPVSPWPGLIAIALLLAAGLGAWAWRRVRRRAPAPRPPDPLAWIATLEERTPEAADDVREAHYRLTRTVRERADAVRGLRRAALTDDEWLRSALPEVSADQRDELRLLFERAARVKYGGERPTQWAVRETLQHGRTVLTALVEAEGRR